MRAFGSTQDPNLTELRGQLAMRIALVFVAASLLLSWLALLPERFPFEVAGLLAGLTVLGLLVRLIGSRRLAVAPVVMVIGIAGWLLVAVYVLTDPWVPFLALPLSVIAALLASGGGFVTAAPAAVLVTESDRGGDHAGGPRRPTVAGGSSRTPARARCQVSGMRSHLRINGVRPDT